jgi:hypothetical protein
MRLAISDALSSNTGYGGDGIKVAVLHNTGRQTLPVSSADKNEIYNIEDQPSREGNHASSGGTRDIPPLFCAVNVQLSTGDIRGTRRLGNLRPKE